MLTSPESRDDSLFHINHLVVPHINRSLQVEASIRGAGAGHGNVLANVHTSYECTVLKKNSKNINWRYSRKFRQTSCLKVQFWASVCAMAAISSFHTFTNKINMQLRLVQSEPFVTQYSDDSWVVREIDRKCTNKFPHVGRGRLRAFRSSSLQAIGNFPTQSVMVIYDGSLVGFWDDGHELVGLRTSTAPRQELYKNFHESTSSKQQLRRKKRVLTGILQAVWEPATEQMPAAQ